MSEDGRRILSEETRCDASREVFWFRDRVKGGFGEGLKAFPLSCFGGVKRGRPQLAVTRLTEITYALSAAPLLPLLLTAP